MAPGRTLSRGWSPILSDCPVVISNGHLLPETESHCGCMVMVNLDLMSEGVIVYGGGWWNDQLCERGVDLVKSTRYCRVLSTSMLFRGLISISSSYHATSGLVWGREIAPRLPGSTLSCGLIPQLISLYAPTNVR
jgi:hypothetical protein